MPYASCPSPRRGESRAVRDDREVTTAAAGDCPLHQVIILDSTIFAYSQCNEVFLVPHEVYSQDQEPHIWFVGVIKHSVLR